MQYISATFLNGLTSVDFNYRFRYGTKRPNGIAIHQQLNDLCKDATYCTRSFSFEYIIDYKNLRGDVHRYPKDENGGRNKVLSITDMDAKRQITTNNATRIHALGDL